MFVHYNKRYLYFKLEKLGLSPSPYGESLSFFLYFNPLTKLNFPKVQKTAPLSNEGYDAFLR